MEGGLNPIAVIADLFYKQGVSFRWLALGYGAIPFLPHNGFTNYTFGSFIDYFCNGSIAQKFFGAVSLGSSNSLLKAQYGNNFSHHLSYILLGDEYLAGHGCGSSYLLEVFADYGYLGIVVFSLILGLFLVCAPIHRMPCRWWGPPPCGQGFVLPPDTRGAGWPSIQSQGS